MHFDALDFPSWSLQSTSPGLAFLQSSFPFLATAEHLKFSMSRISLGSLLLGLPILGKDSVFSFVAQMPSVWPLAEPSFCVQLSYSPPCSASAFSFLLQEPPGGLSLSLVLL